VGTLQVIDYYGVGWRGFLIDGVMQNVVDIETGETIQPFTNYLDALAYHFAPQAKRALVIGLGAGILPRALSRRGLTVTAVDLDHRVEEVARSFFELPSQVRVEAADGRALLRRDRERYDVIFIDVFTGESAPWYLLTVEAFPEAAARLTPSGVLVVNTVTMGKGETRFLQNSGVDHKGARRSQIPISSLTDPTHQESMATPSTWARKSISGVGMRVCCKLLGALPVSPPQKGGAGNAREVAPDPHVRARVSINKRAHAHRSASRRYRRYTKLGT
jgi:predicted O-methyltransferase YrrM